MPPDYLATIVCFLSSSLGFSSGMLLAYSLLANGSGFGGSWNLTTFCFFVDFDNSCFVVIVSSFLSYSGSCLLPSGFFISAGLGSFLDYCLVDS